MNGRVLSRTLQPGVPDRLTQPVEARCGCWPEVVSCASTRHATKWSRRLTWGVRLGSERLCDLAGPGSIVWTIGSVNARRSRIVRVDACSGRVLGSMVGFSGCLPRCDSARRVGDASRFTTGLWDASDGRLILYLLQHACPATTAAFSGDDKWIVAGGTTEQYPPSAATSVVRCPRSSRSFGPRSAESAGSAPERLPPRRRHCSVRVAEACVRAEISFLQVRAAYAPQSLLRKQGAHVRRVAWARWL